MGAVWRAQHLLTGAVHALKTLLPGADAGLRARFQRKVPPRPPSMPTPTWSGFTPPGSTTGPRSW